MRWLRRAIGGANALARSKRGERDLDEELRAYLETAVEEKMRRGLDREQATRVARLELGLVSVESVKDRVRDVGWETHMESIWQDVRYALRTLRKSPAFAAAAVLTLALGIGATTAIFSLLDAVILKSLPVSKPEELVLVGGSQYPVFQAFRQHTGVFADLLATSGVTPLDVEIGGARERTNISLVSGSYFSTLGVRAAMGRVFTVNDDQIPGAHPVAVASYGYWQRRFGGDAAILDRVLRISGTPITIVGVAAAGFFGEQVGEAPDLWVPLTMWGDVVPGPNFLENPGRGWLRMIGRVHPGVSVSGAHPQLTETFRRVVTGVFGPKMGDDVRRDIARAVITLEPAANGLSRLRTLFARPLQVLMAAVVVVLLIACANIASLLLARATARRREIDVRLALGMNRARLVRQLLTESAVLAALGGLVGMAVSWLGREGLLRLISADGSRLRLAVDTDARLLVFVAVVSSGTAILFGLAPAWRAARASVVTSLIARHETSHSHRLGSLLVVAQIALSLVLLTGAGLLLRSIANLRDVDLGFTPERLIVVDINPQAAGYGGDRAAALTRRLLEGIAAQPGVSAASLSEHGVLTGTDNSTDLMRPPGFVAGPEGVPQTRWDVVGPHYFSTLGTSLLAGRDFNERDDAASPFVVAINETMAHLFFGQTNAIGQRLVWGVGGVQLEVVAVARDVKQAGAGEEPPPRFYLPYLQLPAVRPNWTLSSTRFLVRTVGDPTNVASTLREVIRSEDPRLSVISVDIASQLVSRTLVRQRMVAILLVAFSALAVGLACLGLYGLMAYHVVQHTSEIGIRMALGAQRNDVLWATVRRSLAWIVAGITIGIPLALGTSRIAQGLLFGLSANDAGTFIAATIVMTTFGLLAAYIPARRASRIDPLVALRAE